MSPSAGSVGELDVLGCVDLLEALDGVSGLQAAESCELGRIRVEITEAQVLPIAVEDFSRAVGRDDRGEWTEADHTFELTGADAPLTG